jgi:hypothetical protein
MASEGKRGFGEMKGDETREDGGHTRDRRLPIFGVGETIYHLRQRAGTVGQPDVVSEVNLFHSAAAEWAHHLVTMPLLAY